MNRISTCFASLLLSCALTAQAQQYQLNSPDGKLIVNIEAGQTLNWAIAHDGTTVLCLQTLPCNAPKLRESPLLSPSAKCEGDQSYPYFRRHFLPHSFLQKANVKDTYNQLTLKCRNGYSIQFRAYDDGAAYRLFPNCANLSA